MQISKARVVVDLEDWPKLRGFNWCVMGRNYVGRQLRADEGRGHVLMHRLILGLAPGDPRQGDHINRDTLDNRRCNLRICTEGENSQNVPARAGASSRFRGVGWHRQCEKWQAYARANGRNHYLGMYADEVEAARVAEAFRREHLPFAQPDPALALEIGGA